MICLRDGGSQMPETIRKYSNKAYTAYIRCSAVCCFCWLAQYLSIRLAISQATQVFGFDGSATSVSTWVIYGVIFVYYLIATVFPIDKIIGRIYPIFGAILLFSALGVFVVGVCKGDIPLVELWDNWSWTLPGDGGVLSYSDYFNANHFIPIFFITVAAVSFPDSIPHRQPSFPYYEERETGPHDIL